MSEVRFECKKCRHKRHTHSGLTPIGGEPSGCPKCGYNPALEKRQKDLRLALEAELEKELVHGNTS